MSAYDFDLFVIGGGSAGVRCARISATHGARVAVAEERFWGGTCVNVGCVPKKIMVNAGEYGLWAEEAAAFGWQEMVKGQHRWSVLKEARDAEVERLSAIYGRLLANAGVTPFECRATFIDPHTLDVGGRRVTAERIVIATGGHPVKPDIPGAELGMISDDLFTLEEMPRRVAVVGGGYIALEFASLLRALGAEVDLVYRQSLPLRGFDHDIREAMRDALDALGIRQHVGHEIASLEKTADGIRVATAGGQAATVDAVMFATGRVANTGGLNLEAAEIVTGRFGAIPVDARQTTRQPHIFALGDVTDQLNLTPVATAQGHALADTLFGNKPRTANLQNVPTAVFTIPPAATVGLTEELAAAQGPVDIYLTRFTPMRHTISKRARKTVMKLVVDRASQKVVGAHMLGDDAAEMMQGIAIAIVAGATKQDFDATIGIHPTAAEEFVTLRTITRQVG
ncbi:glutathione-disulfide reductase [Roseomonas marmotae]|uniref:Glutathione-disulfide reductase n=1 Tax=Roseomonas marmotae TaxID=2768161 RepID=A0ABS3KKF9_9PROT|nr:glutathione-disulfide reductase [Roseomonas marmotae]MBO1076821.1 glutathione-disulfide reductase [Roseomonas marmotae]QTI78717.1 glutathione-disulfide reductase [Roseomonas marmotae]